MKLIKRPDPDGTFALLDGGGEVVAKGLPEQDADARIAAEAARTASRTTKKKTGSGTAGTPLSGW